MCVYTGPCRVAKLKIPVSSTLLMFRPPHRLLSTAALVTVFAGGLAAQTPTIGAVTNGGDFSNRLCPGAAAAIFGNNMGPAQGMRGAAPGLTVTVGGQNATVDFSASQQVNITIPAGLGPGATNVVLTYQGRASAPFVVNLDAFAPAIVSFGGGATGPPFCLHLSNAQVLPSNPAVPGETISCLVNGIGQGAGITVSLNGMVAQVVSAGTSTVPNTPGLSQVNFVVPSALTPGVNSLVIRIGGFSSNTALLSVGAGAGITLSQTGFTFQAVQGGGAPSPKPLRLLNLGAAPLNFNITVSTTTGVNWLAVDNAAGVIQPGALSTINISVNIGTLAPGDYYGQLRIDATGASNSPQFVSVVLNVNPPNVNPGPVVEPTGLIFVRLVNGPNPPAQSIRITNLINRATAFNTVTDFFGGQRWFTHLPAAGNVAPSQPATVNVTADVALAAGVYRGRVTFNFPQDNTSSIVELLLVVTPEVVLSAQKQTIREAGLCNATRLLPLFTRLGANFNAPAAWPTPIEVQVVDDCGSPMRNGTVSAEFSNGDPPLILSSTLDGRWSGTWAPFNARTPNLQVTATARQADRGLEGATMVGGSVQQNAEIPVIYPNGVLSVASYSSKAQPSPGEIVAIFGARLSDGIALATEVPLKTQLSTTTVTMGGRALPLFSVSDGQVNAIIPYEVAAPVPQQMIVRRGNRVSLPAPVTVLPTEPGIFTTDASGKGQGHIYAIPGPGRQVLAGAGSPAQVGDFLIIYCSGLGPVNPPVVAGSPTPTDALRPATNAVTVSIGGRPARVDFAGLTPASVALYQVNTVVPEGVEPGDSVPVVITAGGVSSPPVTIAVR